MIYDKGGTYTRLFYEISYKLKNKKVHHYYEAKINKWNNSSLNNFGLQLMNSYIKRFCYLSHLSFKAAIMSQLQALILAWGFIFQNWTG